MDIEGVDGGRDCEDSQSDRERSNESYEDKVCVGERVNKKKQGEKHGIGGKCLNEKLRWR